MNELNGLVAADFRRNKEDIKKTAICRLRILQKTLHIPCLSGELFKNLGIPVTGIDIFLKFSHNRLLPRTVFWLPELEHIISNYSEEMVDTFCTAYEGR